MDDLSGLTTEEKSELLKELNQAISSGALRVRFNERDVTYRSLSEMRSIRSDLERSIKGAPRRNVIFTTFNRGL